MPKTETRDDTREPEEPTNLCSFCSFSLNRVIEREDPHWRDGKVERQLVCTNQYIPSYYIMGAVKDCEAFDLYVRDHAVPMFDDDTVPQKEEPTFKERLLEQRNKQLVKELKKLRKKMKKGKRK